MACFSMATFAFGRNNFVPTYKLLVLGHNQVKEDKDKKSIDYKTNNVGGPEG